jgi:hypothetical protein
MDSEVRINGNCNAKRGIVRCHRAGYRATKNANRGARHNGRASQTRCASTGHEGSCDGRQARGRRKGKAEACADGSAHYLRVAQARYLLVAPPGSTVPVLVICAGSIRRRKGSAGQFRATTDPLFPAARQSRQRRVRAARTERIGNHEAGSKSTLLAAVGTGPMKQNGLSRPGDRALNE